MLLTVKMENEHIAAINHFDQRKSNINGGPLYRSRPRKLGYPAKRPILAYFGVVSNQLGS